jgi:hypothetical protein
MAIARLNIMEALWINEEIDYIPIFSKSDLVGSRVDFRLGI